MEAGDGSCFQIKAGDTSEDAHHSAAIPLASPVSPIVEPQGKCQCTGAEPELESEQQLREYQEDVLMQEPESLEQQVPDGDLTPAVEKAMVCLELNPRDTILSMISQVDKLQDACKKYQEDIANKQAKIKHQRKRRSKRSNKVQCLRMRLSWLNQAIGRHEESINQLQIAKDGLEQDNTHLRNELATLQRAQQQNPKGGGMVINFLADTGTSSADISPREVCQDLEEHVRQPASHLAIFLLQQHRPEVDMRVKELVSHDRWHETSEKDSRDKKWCIKPILLHEINLYLSEAIWHGDLGSEALPGGLAAITEVHHQVDRVLGSHNLADADAETITMINRHLQCFTKECEYWRRKYKHDSTIFDCHAEHYAANLVQKLLPEHFVPGNAEAHQAAKRAKRVISGSMYARIATGAVHPLHTLYVPNDPDGKLCTCAGIAICKTLGRAHLEACVIECAQEEEIST